MEYITTRSFPLFDLEGMESHDWFNMWKRKFFPYEELLEGDIIYWYEAQSRRLIYKTEVTYVDSCEYRNKQELVDKYKIDPTGKYFSEGAEAGYFILFQIRVIKKIDVVRPKEFNFPQFGWIKLDDELSKKWFGDQESAYYQNLTTSGASLSGQLEELSKKMQGKSPQRKAKIIDAIIRNDAPIVRALKVAADFACQFPKCGHKIKKKNGKFYIEVAHVKAVSRGGLSILGNLIVLCPNHHKELDYGKLSIEKQTPNRLKGKLNGQEFDIAFSFD